MAKKDRPIVVPILNEEYKVIVCFGSPDQIKKVLDSYGHTPASLGLDIETRRGSCFHTGGCHPVIAMPRKPNTPAEIGTLAHEACHAVKYIFNMISQDSGPEDEIYCHSVGAIVRYTLQKI